MIKIKDLSPEFQEIYIKYKQAKHTMPDDKKTTFEKASEFLLEKNKKLIGMLNAEETIIVNQPKIDSNKSNVSSHISNQLEKNIRKNQGARMKKVIHDMISQESLRIPQDYNVENNLFSLFVEPQNNTSQKLMTSKALRHVKTSSKNNLEKQPSSKLILTLKKTASTQNLTNHTKLLKKTTGIVLDQFSAETLKEITKLKEESQKEKEAIKKSHHLFKLKIQHNEPINISSTVKKMPDKLIDAVDNDLIYYSNLENIYRKGRLMTLQNSVNKPTLNSRRMSGQRNKFKLKFDDISPLVTFQPTQITGTSFKLNSSRSLKMITSKIKTKEAIDDFFSTSKKIRMDFINSMEKTNEKKMELMFKYNFFKSNY